MLITCLGFATVMLFQNCGGSKPIPLQITSSPELAKLSPQNCSIENLNCSKRRYAPGISSAEEVIRECFASADGESCLSLPYYSYDSSGSTTETAERLEYSCWVGPMEQPAAFALRSNLTMAANASLAACREGVRP